MTSNTVTSLPHVRQIRKYILSVRDRMRPEQRAIMSRYITWRLSNMPEYCNARLPLFFISFRSEVCTHEIIRKRITQGLPVAIPKTDIAKRRLDLFIIKDWERDIAPGAYGIPEPNAHFATRINPSETDVVMVPGSIFDITGNRAGYGGGFYDRFFSYDAPHTLRIALAFSFQVLNKITAAPHDKPVDIIVTEKKIIRCERSSRLIKENSLAKPVK